MYLDLVSQDNYINVNIKSAKLFGLTTAVYLSEILAISSKVCRKKKYDADTGYFTIDRDYVTEKTTLDAAAQYSCDKILVKAGILDVCDQDPNKVRINTQTYVSIITSEDQAVLKDVAKAAKVSAADKKAAKAAGIITTMQKIACENEDDPDLVNLYQAYVTAVYAAKRYLTRESIKVVKDGLKNFAAGDKAVLVKLLEIGVMHGYTDPAWICDIFSKSYKQQMKVNEQKIGSSVNNNITF